eukprot:scaffold5999_cov149-Amphora_coffeaeformis.AAC.5
MSDRQPPEESAAPPPSQKDLDCASLARDALFPLKIQREDGGHHATQFPASVALGKVRIDAMKNNPYRSPSSFFPAGMAVVHDVETDELQLNGQPYVDETDASLQAIPNLLRVRCQPCGRNANYDYFVEKYRLPKVRDEKISKDAREIVLCTDRVMKSDYMPQNAKSSSLTLPSDEAPRSLVAVETALAHAVTKIGSEVERERKGRGAPTDVPVTCRELAAMELQAAAAAECFYTQTTNTGSEGAKTLVKRGPALGHAGFSVLYPIAVREMLRDRCMKAVATQRTADEFGIRQGRKCVSEVFSSRGHR